jgi:hypothetical protein
MCRPSAICPRPICARLDAEEALQVPALRGIGADWSARIRVLRGTTPESS